MGNSLKQAESLRGGQKSPLHPQVVWSATGAKEIGTEWGGARLGRERGRGMCEAAALDPPQAHSPSDSHPEAIRTLPATDSTARPASAQLSPPPTPLLHSLCEAPRDPGPGPALLNLESDPGPAGTVETAGEGGMVCHGPPSPACQLHRLPDASVSLLQEGW